MPRKTNQTTVEVPQSDIPTTVEVMPEDTVPTVPIETQNPDTIHIERDEFCSPIYIDPFAKLPRIQVP